MECEPDTYLQGQAGEYSQTSFLGINQCLPLKSQSSPVASYESGSRGCTCTKETPGCSIHPSGLDEWIASQRDSLATILASLEQAMASTASIPDCGQRCGEPFARFAPDTSSWRTDQLSLLGGYIEFSETWPRWGMMRNGACWEQETLAHPTDETDGGAWPSPTATDAKARAYQVSRGRVILSLVGAVRMWPTPCATDGKSPYSAEGFKRQAAIRSKPLRDVVNAEEGGGRLNPTWAEWLMGWPIEHTALRQSDTGRCQSAPQLHGACSEGR